MIKNYRHGLIDRTGAYKVNYQPKRKRSGKNTRMYMDYAWDGLRYKQLKKEKFCRMCMDKGLYVEAKVVDHIEPHKGDIDLFRDETNLQSLCGRCHNAKSAQEMHRQKHDERKNNSNRKIYW